MNLGYVRAAAGPVRRESVQSAGVCGRVVELSVGSFGEACNLPGRGSCQQHRRSRQALYTEELAVRAGGHEHSAGGVECRVVGRVGGRLPNHVPDSVRCNAVHGAACCCRWCRGPGARDRRRRGGGGRSAGRDRDRHARGHDRRGRGTRRGRLPGADWRRCPAGGKSEDRTVGGKSDRCDFVVTGVEEHEGPTARIDTQHPAGRAGPGDEKSARVQRQRSDVCRAGVVQQLRVAGRRDPVYAARVPRTGVQGAVGRRRQRPDIGFIRIEHLSLRPGRVEADDSPVRRRCRKDLTAGANRQRLDIPRSTVHDGGDSALRSDPVDHAGRAAADPQCILRTRERPEKRNAGLENALRVRAQQQAPARVDGHVVSGSAQ